MESTKTFIGIRMHRGQEGRVTWVNNLCSYVRLSMRPWFPNFYLKLKKKKKPFSPTFSTTNWVAKINSLFFTVLEVTNPKLVLLGWNQDPGRANSFPPEAVGENLFSPLTFSTDGQRSFSCGYITPVSASMVTLSSLLISPAYLCLSLVRTCVVAIKDHSGNSRIISPFKDPEFNNISKVTFYFKR